MKQPNAWFSERDLAIVEALEYDPNETPGYELIKGCLIWPDEVPMGLTNEGWALLQDLWIARAFMHRGPPDPALSRVAERCHAFWDMALAKNLRWPGFHRVHLSARDRKFLEDRMKDPGEF